MNRSVALMLLCAIATAANAGPSQILKLSPTENYGATPNSFPLPGGTQLSDTVFYASRSSHLAVGRASVNGPLMPRATANYTDMFMVAAGSGTLIESDGKAHELRAGDFVLLPRGLTFEMRGADHYIHYFASFDTGKDAVFNGPVALRLLHPRRLKDSDFVDVDGVKSHTYYQDSSGVTVSDLCYPGGVHDLADASELMFVVSGSGTLRQQSNQDVPVRAGDTFFIPKSAMAKLDAAGLCTLAVRFDRTKNR